MYTHTYCLRKRMQFERVYCNYFEEIETEKIKTAPCFQEISVAFILTSNYLPIHQWKSCGFSLQGVSQDSPLHHWCYPCVHSCHLFKQSLNCFPSCYFPFLYYILYTIMFFLTCLNPSTFTSSKMLEANLKVLELEET